MDATRFDALTQLLCTATTRRATVKWLGLSLTVTLAAVTGQDDRVTAAVPTATCKSKGAQCRMDSQCCSQRCIRHKGTKSGACACVRLNDRCNRGADCCRFDPSDPSAYNCYFGVCDEG